MGFLAICLLAVLSVSVVVSEHNVFPAGPNRKGREKTLYIGGMFPMTGSWAGGKGCRPAVEMALDDVNNKADILPGYALKMVHNDSRVRTLSTLYFIFILSGKNLVTSDKMYTSSNITILD